MKHETITERVLTTEPVLELGAEARLAEAALVDRLVHALAEIASVASLPSRVEQGGRIQVVRV